MMLIMTTLFTLMFSITIILILMVNLISKKSFTDREKSSPFECGFEPKSLARLPFSIQFFLIAMIFLIFDVEIALILPMIIIMKNVNIMMFSFIFAFFMIILLVGLFHEWSQNVLNWMI
uniref:NADH-ubiquinone oxidoreductase chain 3 n=1 Tax=Coleoptera sp. ACP-2013 TaxID=2485033 RepID=A0A3G3MED8_9COLE|nr:NADH dehydrogenase subunit 3 [Coleoptera sp. ACP-2013]